MKYAIVILLALFAAISSNADTIQTSDGTLVTPDGSTLTSLTSFVDPTYQTMWIADFTFADGSGYVFGNDATGDAGQIIFTVPVTSLDLNLTGVVDGFYTWDGDISGDVLFSCGTSYTWPPVACPNSETYSFTNTDIASLWYGLGSNGASSLSYTEDPPNPVPEPGTFFLTASVLVGLCWMKARKA